MMRTMRKPEYWVEAQQTDGRWLGLSMWERQARAEAEMERLAAYQRSRRYRVTCAGAVVALANDGLVELQQQLRRWF
jgi:hypothetical protein